MIIKGPNNSLKTQPKGGRRLKEGAALAEPILVVVVGTACQEGQGWKVTRPPLTGHMTQDPRDPSQ